MHVKYERKIAKKESRERMQERQKDGTNEKVKIINKLTKRSAVATNKCLCVRERLPIDVLLPEFLTNSYD